MQEDESVGDYLKRSLEFVSCHKAIGNEVNDKDLAIGIVMGMPQQIRSEIANRLLADFSMNNPSFGGSLELGLFGVNTISDTAEFN